MLKKGQISSCSSSLLALKSLGRFAWPLFHLMTDKSVSHKKGHHLSPFFTHSLCFFLLCWKDVQKDHRYTLVGTSDGIKVVPDPSTKIARSHVLLVPFLLWYQKISLQSKLTLCYQISIDQNPKPFFQNPATRRPSFTITTW